MLQSQRQASLAFSSTQALGKIGMVWQRSCVEPWVQSPTNPIQNQPQSDKSDQDGLSNHTSGNIATIFAHFFKCTQGMMPEKYKAFDNEITKYGRLSHRHANRKPWQATRKERGDITPLNPPAKACSRICQCEEMK